MNRFPPPDPFVVARLPENLRTEFVAAYERIHVAAGDRRMLRLEQMKDYLLRVIPYSDPERAMCPDWSVSTGQQLTTKNCASMLSLAKNKSQVVRFSHEFAQLLAESPAPAFYDPDLVHAVYPVIVAEFDGGVYVKQFNMTVQCLLAWACAPDEEKMFATKIDPQTPDGHYFFGVFGIGYDATGLCDCFAMPWMFNEDGEHIKNGVEWCELFGLARAVFDLLASPSVRLEREDVAKVNAKRKKKDRPPLTPYEVVRWSRTSVVSEGTGRGGTHGHRYDVRGNWATFTKGRLAGRRIWRKPHQRGVANLVHGTGERVYEVQ